MCFLTYIGLKNLVLDLILALQNLPAARLLPSPNGRGILLSDLLRFASLVVSDDFDIKLVIPLLNKVVDEAPDADIWGAVYGLVTESTPPPRPLPYLDRTPISFNTGSLANTSEYRKHFDGALKDELDSSLYIDIPGFFDTFFGELTSLESVAEAVFRKCKEGENPLYKDREGGGWRDWPEDAQEEKVLKWFKERIDMFVEFAKENGAALSVQRRPLGQPSQHLSGSTPKRKLDIGFANGMETSENFRYDWSKILVPGELKSNPNADRRTDTWLDLARYARHVLTAQDTRRFVLGFTLCGSIMRLWEFDRLGGIASSPFDINKEGLQFVSAALGYLWMNKEQLGFDPTILESDGKRYIEIMRNDKTERLVIVELMKRHSSVAGRATTCWKAYRDGDKSKMILVIKDSWQYPEREEEGELLSEATEKGAVNVARYYHHETVRVGGKDDDINGNVRKGLGIMKATDAFRHTSATSKTEDTMPPSSTSGGRTARKRSSSSLNPLLPPNKRSCSTSPHADKGRPELRNRIHRRVILRDYGKNIYKASSRAAMLAALEGNIAGMRYGGDYHTQANRSRA
jgi:Fungal protein kinase